MTSHRLLIQFYINHFLTTLIARQSTVVLGCTGFRTQILPDCPSELQEIVSPFEFFVDFLNPVFVWRKILVLFLDAKK